MARRQLPEVNAGSMADIAFIMLIFFIVSTTLAQDRGIKTLLPKWSDIQGPDVPIHKRNALMVEVTPDGEFLIESEILMEADELRKEVPVFMLNNGRRDDYSISYQEAVINLTTHPDAPYQSYLLAYSSIVAGFNDIRNEAAEVEYGIDYTSMLEDVKFTQQTEHIRAVFPLRFIDRMQDLKN